MSSSGAVQAYEVSPWGNSLLTADEEAIPRWIASNAAITMTSGTLRLTYFTARKTQVCNNVRSASGGTASAVPTLARMGFYSVAANGDLALLAACANDVTIWSATFADYSSALTAPFNKVMGVRYAAAALYVGTTAPTVYGANIVVPPEGSNAIRLSGALTAQVDLPASITNASLANTGSIPYIVAAA